MSRNAAVTEEKILDLAEKMIRDNGYNGFSFREIASGIGVKSSSVHYYFPAKSDLGVKVANRYSERFMDALGDPADAPKTAEAVLNKVHGLFVSALQKDGQMCLCGVLAAETPGLPADVAMEAKAFFDRVTKWLVVSLRRTDWGKSRPEDDLQAQALSTLALLEGGMMVARVQGRPDLLASMKPQLAD
ncbi:TetR/AcrR family transcriptional regulator [Roseibium sp.]|uniref:TetR/AcrR family transcriptional regulator n=1 Tax=Roseibium sp. TaxID=1936156 RepID=UPI003B526C3C